MVFGTVDIGKWWTTNLNPSTVNCPIFVNTDAFNALTTNEQEALLSSVDEALDYDIANYNNKTMKAWGTPTEGGAIDVFIVLVMSFYRGISIKQLGSALLESAKLSAIIFSIIWGVLIYVRFLGFANLPETFYLWLSSLDFSPLVILIIILSYAVLGMFMDAIGMMLNLACGLPSGKGTQRWQECNC